MHAVYVYISFLIYVHRFALYVPFDMLCVLLFMR